MSSARLSFNLVNLGAPVRALPFGESMNHAKSNAKAWSETIHLAYLALNPDAWEALDQYHNETLKIEDPEEFVELERMAEEFHTEDEAPDIIQEMILDVRVSGEWAPGQTPEATDYTILLSTGGPALRIAGELGRYSEPVTARLEYQDWGTPWIEYTEADPDELLTFASQFYFGE